MKRVLFFLVCIILGASINLFINMSVDDIQDHNIEAQKGFFVDGGHYNDDFSEVNEQLEDEIISRYVDKTSILKEEFNLKLDAVIKKATAEYGSLSPEEREKEKYDLGFRYMDMLNDLEHTYEEELDIIINEMSDELVSSGFTDGVAQDMKQLSLEEKNATKQTLIAEVMKNY